MAQRKKQLLAVEQEQLNRLHTIVENSIREEELVVNNLLHPPSETLKRGQRISDKIARFGGSWAFILIFLGILTVWIVFNVTVVLSDRF
ncbi:MAG TPA: DUF1003 domain-containing protein, partial [Flavobacteriales bacterium]|nr:DUF1003 domain-containing protein [Flavobacteriales bacterium]